MKKTATVAAIERDAALAWFERYYAEAMAAVIAEQGAQARLEIQAAEGAYRAGRGNQADVFAARSALAGFDDRASDIERRIRNGKTMLARWIGAAADLPLAAKPATDAIRLEPASLDSQLLHHPDIAVLVKREEIAETEAQLARANKKSPTGAWSLRSNSVAQPFRTWCLLACRFRCNGIKKPPGP
ncbi:TolC family protein [Undibacterium arcticum]